MSRPDKPRVRAAFDRAAAAYDRASAVQREVCEALLRRWHPEAADTPWPDAPQVLDAGCGTGHGARLLRARWPQAHLAGIDLAPAMVATARPLLDVACVGDIEDLPLHDASLDAWWSSLAVQWCDLPRALSEAARVLRPGGWAVFSTLGSGTFDELRQAFAQVDRHVHTLDFSDGDRVPQALQHAGLSPVSLERLRLTVHHDQLRPLLQDIKAIGANTIEGRRPGLLGRQAWEALQSAYEGHREARGLPLSYDVVLAVARKPLDDGRAAPHNPSV